MGREAAILDYEIVCETNPPNGRFEFDEDRDNYFRQERGGSSDNEEEEEHVEERPERGEAVNDIQGHVDVVDDDRSKASHDAEDRNDYFRQEWGGDSDNEEEGTDVWPERRPVMIDDIHGDCTLWMTKRSESGPTMARSWRNFSMARRTQTSLENQIDLTGSI